MSMENNLKRIADALEKLLELQFADKQPDATTVSDADIELVVKPAPAKKALVHEKTPKPAPEKNVSVSDPAMTMEELNAAIVFTYTRIGNDMAAINTVLVEVAGEPTIANLDPSKYAELLTKIEALATPDG